MPISSGAVLNGSYIVYIKICHTYLLKFALTIIYTAQDVQSSFQMKCKSATSYVS